MGANVPPGYAVSTFAYRKFMVQLNEQVSAVLDAAEGGSIDSVNEASEKIGNLVRATPVPPDVAESIVGEKIGSLVRATHVPPDIAGSIVGAYGRLAGVNGDIPVAVRSSATGEDTLNASVAGQHETFLWVRGAENVVEHVRECWASAFATRSLSYRKARGTSQVGVQMGVVVQKMVKAAKSGVMFTLNPMNGDPSKISIDAAWGLGEAVVSGVVTPDLFLVDKVTMEILEKKVGAKQVEFVVSRDSVVEMKTPADMRGVLCLTDDEVTELGKVGKALEKAFGRPQDIEWAMETDRGNSTIFVLQARPETVWSSKGAQKTRSMDAVDRVVDTLKKR